MSASVCTVVHKSQDPYFHKKYMEAGVMTFVAHCTSVRGSRFYLSDDNLSKCYPDDNICILSRYLSFSKTSGLLFLESIGVHLTHGCIKVFYTSLTSPHGVRFSVFLYVYLRKCSISLTDGANEKWNESVPQRFSRPTTWTLTKFFITDNFQTEDV